MGNLSIIRILMGLSLLPLLAACNDESSKIFISSMRAKATFENIPDLPASAVVDIHFDLSGTEGNQINSIEAYSNLNGKQELIQTLSGDQRSFTWNIPEAKNIGLTKEKDSKPAQLVLKVIGRTATTENLSNSFSVVNMGTLSINSKVFFKNTTSFEIGKCAYSTTTVTPYCNTMMGTGTSGGSCAITCESGKLLIKNLPTPSNNSVLNVSTFIGIKLKTTDIKIQYAPVFYIDTQVPKITSFQFLEPFTDQFVSIEEGSNGAKVISTTKLKTLEFTVQDEPLLPENNITTSVLIDDLASTAFSESNQCTGTNPKICRINDLFISQTKGEHKISIKSTDASGNSKKSDFLIYYKPTEKPVITTLTASRDQKIAAIESGDSLNSLNDYSTDVPSNQNGAGEYYVRFKAVDPDDHATLQPQLMKNKSGLKSIVVSAVDNDGNETNQRYVLDPNGTKTSDCVQAIASTGVGQYYCAKIRANDNTKHIKVSAADRSGNTATRVFKINLGVGARVMAGADSGSINFSGNQSANFSKVFGSSRGERGLKIDSKNIIYFLKFEGSYGAGGLYTVHPRDGIVRKIVNFNVTLDSTQLSTASTGFSFDRPYQTSLVTSFDLDSKDDSILYLYELRKQVTSNTYKANIRKFKLTYAIQSVNHTETPFLTMREADFEYNQSSTIEADSTTANKSFTVSPSIPLPSRLQVYSIEKGLFFTSYAQNNNSDLYMISLVENKMLTHKMDTPVYNNSDNNKMVDCAAPVMVGNQLYFLTQNSREITGGRAYTNAIIPSNSNQTTLPTAFNESDHAYSFSIALNKRGDLDQAVLFSQPNLSQYYKDNTGTWKSKKLLGFPSSNATGFNNDGENLTNSIRITLNDLVPLEDKSFLMIDGSLIRLLEPLENGTNFRLTTLMGENPGINPGFNQYLVTHPLSIKLGLLSNLKPFRNANINTKPIVKLTTYDHTAGKIFEFTDNLNTVKHVAGNGETGAASFTMDATLSPTTMSNAGRRSSTVGYNSSGTILYGYTTSIPILELVDSKLKANTDLIPSTLNKIPATKRSHTQCLDRSGGDFPASYYQYSLMGDSSDFQAIGSHYFDFTCNAHRSNHIKIIDGSTSFTVGNSDVLSDGRYSPNDKTLKVDSCFTDHADKSNCHLLTDHNAGNSHGQVSKVGSDYWVSSSFNHSLIRVSPSITGTKLMITARAGIHGFAPFKETNNTQSVYICEGGKFTKWTGLDTNSVATKVPATTVPELPCRPGNLLRRSEASNSILFLMPQGRESLETSVVEFTQSP